jgi:hypothetical protein
MKHYKHVIIKAVQPGVRKLNELNKLINEGWEIEKIEKTWDNTRGNHLIVYVLSMEKDSLLETYPNPRVC